MAPPELIPLSVPVRAVPGLTASQAEKLEALWVTSAQEFIALAQIPRPGRDLLARMLGVDSTGLQNLLSAALKVVPRTRADRGNRLDVEAMTTVYGLGALLEEPQSEISRRESLPPYRAGKISRSLPQSVDLLDQLPPLRNQGSRGTCVAFAVLSLREQLEIAVGAPTSLDLSEQYVYWWCKGHDGIPTKAGTYVSLGMRCLMETGAPLEADWPYVPDDLESEGQGPPPPAAAKGNPAYRALRILEFNRSDTEGIRSCLAEGRAVAFSIPVYGSWYYSQATRRWGKVTLPLPGESPEGGHAMALVGYQDDPAAPGGGYYLIRNSWQPWSYDGLWRHGYGYLPYAYIQRHATALYSALRVSDGGISLRDSLEDRGRRPLTKPRWNSPDIWVRRQADGGAEHQLPRPGSEAAVYVNVRNPGAANCYLVSGDLLAAPLSPVVPEGAWRSVAKLQLRVLAPGANTCAPIMLPPDDGRPQAFMVALGNNDDPLTHPHDWVGSDNVVRKHSWPLVLAPGASSEIAFEVMGAGGLFGAASFRVELETDCDQLILSPIRVDAGSRWESAEPRAVVPDAVIGAASGAALAGAGERRWARLTVALSEHAVPGTACAFVIAQLRDDHVLGRMTVEVKVSEG